MARAWLELPDWLNPAAVSFSGLLGGASQPLLFVSHRRMPCWLDAKDVIDDNIAILTLH